MSIIQILLEKRQFVLFLVTALTVAGIIGCGVIPRAEDPGFVIRNAIVMVRAPGVSAPRMELMIAKIIEKKLQEMSELEYIRSESRDGLTIMRIKIWDRYKNVRPIWDSLRRKVNDIKGSLPAEAEEPIINDEYGDVFGIIYGMSIPHDVEPRVVEEFAKQLRTRLLLVEGVAKVNIEGAQSEYVFIEYDASKLSELNMPVEYMRNFMVGKNTLESGGVIRTNREAIFVEPSGAFLSLDEIRNTMIPIGPYTTNGKTGSGMVSLSSIAEVYRGYQDPPSYKIRHNGAPCIALAISMTPESNIVELGTRVQKAIDEFKVELPIGVDIYQMWSQNIIVNRIVSDFVVNLLEAMVIVCAVLVVFLKARVGLLVSAMAPIIILISIFIMSLTGTSLNQISIAALIVALGMVVDNSVVISESIMVGVNSGRKIVDVSKEVVAKLAFPLFVSTAIICLAFLPIYTAPSQIGEYTGQLFTVVSTALMVSLCCSMTFVPILCIYVLGNYQMTEEGKSDFKVKYCNFLIKCLRKKYQIIGMTVLLFCLSVISFSAVTRMFMPKSDLPYFTIEIELPKNAPFNWMEKQVDEVEAYIKSSVIVSEENKYGIDKWVSYLGNGGPRYRLVHDPELASPYYTFILARVNSEKHLDATIAKLSYFIYMHCPDVKMKLRRLEMGQPVKHPVEIKISGDSVVKIRELVDEVKAKLDTLDGTMDVADDMGLPGKRLAVIINDVNAIRSQITNRDIALSLSALFTGVPVSIFRERDKLIPIVMRSRVSHVESDVIASSYDVMSSTGGKPTPLLAVSDVVMKWEPSIILRENGLRYIQAVANTKPGYTAADINNIMVPWLAEQSKTWPAGYVWSLEGEAKASVMAMRAISSKIPMAVFCILSLMLLYFNCVRRVFIVLLTFPFSMTGAIFGLLIAGSYFGFMTMLGVIALAGVVFGNAIVLIDRIDYEVGTNKRNMHDAIVSAAQSRIRPIFLTASSTVLGMLPLWLGGSTLFSPLSVVIIFGLSAGTFLTLIIVPSLFAALFKVDFAEYVLSDEVFSESPNSMVS